MNYILAVIILHLTTSALGVMTAMVFWPDCAKAQDCENPLEITSYSSEEIRLPKWKWTRAKNDAGRGERYVPKFVEVCDGKADALVVCIRSKPDEDGKVEEKCSVPSVPIVVPEPKHQLFPGLALLALLGWRRKK